ncbi:efflux transporter outer membrane subunit [Citromicrobium bathyomarinum]|uniref:efflux transporter outer membrane subunit n=1 Tax=Citromicrobium bathyomarinum TaxID=72174 RepID=UPI00315ABAEA
MVQSRTRMMMVRGKAPLLGLSLLVTLGGCATMGEPSVPSSAAPQVPERWAIADPTGPEIELQAYWQLLDDPLVDRFVERAQSGNLDLAQAASRLRLARTRLREARAGRLPSVSANAGVGRDVGDFAPDDLQLVLGADIAWEADLFGRISGSINASEANLRAAGYTLADLERAIVGSVATQTITARSLARQLAISRNALANQEDNLQIAQWRNQAGLVSSLDVEQARTQRAQTAASIPQLESDLIATANVISTLIGEPPGAVYAALIADTRALPVPPRSVGLAVPAEILRRRPDVSAAEAQLAADLAQVGIARAQLSPFVRLTGTVGSTALGVDNLLDVITGNLFAGITQLLFDGGRTRAQIDGAQAIADGSLAAWRQSILVALEEVETASVRLDATDERVAAFIEASDGARNAAILARSQYEAGLIDFQTLLNVESSLLSAETAEVSAEAARAIAFINLARALGGGWRAPQAIEAAIETGPQQP